MKDRIENLLRVEGISSSKFADEIGVQRSSISHIISGRNNPSLDLIQKILSRYRNLNSEWLITGRGEMFKTSATDIQQPIQQLFTPIQEIKPKEEVPEIPENIEFEHNKQTPEAIIKSEKKQIERILVFYTDKTFEEYSRVEK